MPSTLTNKIALITGASRGIGRSIATLFAQNGATVAMHYNSNRLKAEKSFKELPLGQHILVQADLKDPVSIETMVSAVISKFGRIDILVNNAGIFEQYPVLDISYQEWQERWGQTIGINLTGAANTSFCVIQHMKKQGNGKIINISSRGAFRGEPEAPDYGASKAGLNSLSQSLAKALAPHNIFVYAVAPGFVRTDMVSDLLSGESGDTIRSQSPLGRAAEPEEIAETVAFLASDKASSYLTGCIIDINGASYLR